uniref:Uncharacterized protein n=1 Tax=Solanum tuberosum TaxID=4113 RepID=M1DW98_SOLTU
MDRLSHFGITNLDRLPRPSITMGSVSTFRHNYGIGYHVPMVNTRFNGIRPVAPVNAPVKESTARGHGQGRGRGRGRVEPAGNGAHVENAPMNENPPAHNEEIEENVDIDVDDLGQEGERLVGPGVFPSAQALTNPHITSTAPKVGGTGGNDAFFCLLLGSVMIGNEHEMLTKFLKLKPPVFLGSKNEDAYKMPLWRWVLPLWRSRYGGVVVTVVDPTRIKVVNKPLNDLIMHFSTFRAKERSPGDSYSFFTILEAKGHLEAATDRPHLGDQ